MANKRTQMRKVRELLRLNFEQNISAYQAAKIIGVEKTAASQYISGFKASGLNISNVEAMSDSELLNILNLKKETENLRYKVLSNQFSYFEKELKRTGVTLQLLWKEYSETHTDYYGYSQFCHHYLYVLFLRYLPTALYDLLVQLSVSWKGDVFLLDCGIN